jgi:ABC-2 type transport system permease protein
VLAKAFVPGRLSTADRASIDGIRLSLAGAHLSQMAFGVLGALFITSESGMGMIRAPSPRFPSADWS